MMMPAIRFTKMSEQTLKPVLSFSPASSFLKVLTVMGMHHAKGMSAQPIETQPIIMKILTRSFMVLSLSVAFAGASAEQPHFTQTTASSSISAPQCVQYFINSLQQTKPTNALSKYV